MTLPLACADFAFPLLPHQNSLDVISMLGFDGVDIGLFEGRSHLHPSREFTNPSAADSGHRFNVYSAARTESPNTAREDHPTAG